MKRNYYIVTDGDAIKASENAGCTIELSRKAWEYIHRNGRDEIDYEIKRA